MMRFRNRTDAGQQLAAVVVQRGIRADLVLALPRGGVPVAVPVAQAIDAPLDVFVTRKVGAPSRPEYGIGAVAEGGVAISDETALRLLGVSPDAFERLVENERRELDRRVRLYRGDRPLPDIGGRDVILVDDGLATGVTAEASIRALRAQQTGRIELCVPVCSPDTAARLRNIADGVVCVHEPSGFYGVGQFYDRFDQTSDDEVLDLLERTAEEAGARSPR